VISNAGAGYLTAPAVRLTGATGAGATAVAVLSSTGTIQSVDLTNAGTGYTTYTVVIDPPLTLIKQNVLSSGGISMTLATDALSTITQLVEPSNAQ
jgi:hypothetical protein